MELTPGQALTQLDEIQKLILEHQSKQNYSQGFGSPAEKVKAILREYEDKTVRAFNGATHVRDRANGNRKGNHHRVGISLYSRSTTSV